MATVLPRPPSRTKKRRCCRPPIPWHRRRKRCAAICPTGVRPTEPLLVPCPGAGGRTLAMAAARETNGQLFAYDSDRNRRAPFYDRLRRNGVRNAQVRAPAGDALADLEGKMDRVVIDAPC